MIIHGDNLEALKALLPRYEGRINCIYIDPPYNTGNENWVYNDNVNDPKIRKWLGQAVGKEGEDLSRHDKWLCMIYPRLKLLQKLLADDGAIFISIDDNEQANLKLICDEIFGANNFVAQMPRITKKSGKSTEVFAKNHDYIFVYAKSKQCSLTPLEHNDAAFKYQDEYWKSRGYYKLNQTLDYDSLQYSSNLDYPIIIDGRTYYPGSSYEKYIERRKGKFKRADWAWRWSKNKFKFGFEHGFIVIKHSKNGTRIYTKTYQNATIGNVNGEYVVQIKKRTAAISSLKLVENEFSNDSATKVLTTIFGEKIFDYSKPPSIIEFICKIATDKSSIVLDSFAGSGTTAHAVLKMNQEDGGQRKFILVEMMDYAESITAERVRRVIHGYGSEKKAVKGTGGNFSYYELGEPILLDTEHINEHIGTEKIREYIWFTETNTPYIPPENSNPYFLGNYNRTDYYFFYKPKKITTLDYKFLSSIKHITEGYVIYADRCALGEKELLKDGIVFKKIPRDIARL